MVETIVKQQVVNIYAEKWAHLRDNQHCRLMVDTDGHHCWVNAQGYDHRVDESGVQDGPAWIDPVGRECWSLNGLEHRLDGPAIISPMGDQYWCINGNLHRLDGPAVIHKDGRQYWYLDNKPLSQEEWAADPRVIAYHSRTQEGAEQWLTRL